MNLSSPAAVGALLRRHNLYPQKRYGQNFLVDANILARIVDAGGVQVGGQAFEIGAGLGVLTTALAEAVGVGGKVVTVEVDRALVPVLAETLSGLPQVEVIETDVLKLDLTAEFASRFDPARPIAVVANIPYQITSPLIGALVAQKARLSSIVVLVQKEVADRIAAPAASDAYGAFGVFCQYHCEVETVMTVPASVFYPNPKVASAVVRLTPRLEPPVDVEDEELLFRVVRAAFGQRRKTLSNALSNSQELGWTRDETATALDEAGIRPDVRGETLTLAQFAAIANAGAK